MPGNKRAVRQIAASARLVSPSPGPIAAAATAYALESSPSNLVALQRAVEPPRQELFRRLNVTPGATGALVDLRRRLLRVIRWCSTPRIATNFLNMRPSAS